MRGLQIFSLLPPSHDKTHPLIMASMCDAQSSYPVAAGVTTNAYICSNIFYFHFRLLDVLAKTS